MSTPSPAAAARPSIADTRGPHTSPPFVPIAGGHRLYVRDWGAGRPVVLLAGWGMDGRCWGDTMSRLNEAGLRTIAYDRRGHGRSTDPGACSYDVLADDLAAVLDALQLTDVALVAHSGAGGEVLRYLARHGRGRVSHAVLVGATGPRMLAAHPDEPGVPPELAEAVLSRIAHDLAGWIAENVEPFAPGVDEVTRRWMESMPMETSRRMLVDFQRAILTSDLTQDARTTPVPVTLIHGDRDESAPIDLTARRYAELIPESRLIVYDGAAHGLMFTHAERLAADILRTIP